MKSVAENTVAEMTEWIVAQAGRVIDRDLTGVEEALIEFAVQQMKYEFWRD